MVVQFPTFMVKFYYIYGWWIYYIYGQYYTYGKFLLQFMVGITFMVFITFMGDTLGYQCIGVPGY